MTYDSWKLRSPDDEQHRGLPYRDCPDCGGNLECNDCERCDEEDAEQERYEYEMQARIEAHDNEAQ